MKLLCSLFLLSLTLLCASTTYAWPQDGNEFRWQGVIADGKAIEIKGVNGEVRAEAASGNQVEVIATKQWRRSDPQSVNIRLVEHTNGVTICAVYPRRNGEPGHCEPGSGGQSAYDNDVKVEFTVRVPASVRFIGRTVNGSVTAKTLGSNVEAYTVNGNVKVSTASHAQARTVNGSISVACGRADWNEALEFNTVNGSIELSLPETAQTDIQARTVNGSISTELPLFVRGTLNMRRLDGVIGGGGESRSSRQLKMETVNGSIRVNRTM
jgi:hypothetical protein